MLLYLVYDTDKKTLSTPLLAPTLEIAQTSLNQLNPENLSSLILYPLATLTSPLDLLLLTVDENKPFPPFIIGEASPKEMQANTSEAREPLHPDLIDTSI